MQSTAKLMNRGEEILAELSLSAKFPDSSEMNFANCKQVLEDEYYEIRLETDEFSSSEVQGAGVYVNGHQIGTVMNGKVDFLQGESTNPAGGQPFLCLYDLVVLSFQIHLEKGETVELFSEYLVCLSKDSRDVENIENMLRELFMLDDMIIGEWMFSEHKRNDKIGLTQGKWMPCTYRSFSSYVQLLVQIASTYQDSYIYFKTMGKHRITKITAVIPYKKAKSVTPNSFRWLMQNTEQMAVVPIQSGVQYLGKNYLPLRIKTEAYRKNQDIYENRVVVSFLQSVLQQAKRVQEKFSNDLHNEQEILRYLNRNAEKGYSTTILTIKSFQIAFCKHWQSEMNRVIDLLQHLLWKYRELFSTEINEFKTAPKKTKIFQEIRPYAKVFDAIMRWLRYGEYSVDKDQLVLQIKTLDKLFEYYCLFRLLHMLKEHSYGTDDSHGGRAYSYSVKDGKYQHEKDIANTYLLHKGDTQVTLYFQPVVYSSRFENNLSLFRTTGGAKGYYTPDFVLKFARRDSGSESAKQEAYIILDAKFSSRENVKKNGLPEIIKKYSNEMETKNPGCDIKLVWALQGRMQDSESGRGSWHNSPLANRYLPRTSYGVLPVNTNISNLSMLWNEIKRYISWA